MPNTIPGLFDDLAGPALALLVVVPLALAGWLLARTTLGRVEFFDDSPEAAERARRRRAQYELVCWVLGLAVLGALLMVVRALFD